MIKKSEVATLLALAASLERSGWKPEDVDVEAWYASAVEFQWPSFEAARRALVIYRNEQPDYPIRPGHITQVLKRVRDHASKTFVRPELPAEVEDDLTASQQWLAAQVDQHHRQAMDRFAGGVSSAPPKAIEG